MPNLELKVPPPILILLVALAMLGVACLEWLPLPIPLTWRIPSGIVIAGVALAILATCKRQLDRKNTTWLPTEPEKATALVTDGIFRYTRNPMYLTAVLFLTGVGVIVGNMLALVLVPCFILYIGRFQIAPEERALEGIFGEAYREYKRSVRRWV
jgi:protein-S-isoprenylcysteine O-methyltransferase Ste14